MSKAEFRIGGVPQKDPDEGKDLTADAGPAADKPDPDKTLQEKVISALRQVFDPEIPVNIYELGLIYEVNIDDDKKVAVKMTLTSPACPVAGSLPLEVRSNIVAVPEVNDCEVELVWEPPWDREKMSDVAKLKLGML